MLKGGSIPPCSFSKTVAASFLFRVSSSNWQNSRLQICVIEVRILSSPPVLIFSVCPGQPLIIGATLNTSENEMTDRVESGLFHIRALDPNVGVILAHGGVTVAYEVKDNGDVVAAAALCSWEDVFSRQLGRTIAVGRLFTEREQDMRMVYEESVLRHINGGVGPVVSKGRSGENYVREADYPLVKVLMMGSKFLLAEAVNINLRDTGMQEVTAEDIVIERFGKSYVFSVAQEPYTGERLA